MPTLRPGQYEKRVERARAGGRSGAPTTSSVCVSEQDAKDIGAMLNDFRRQDCSDSPHKTVGATTTFTRTCRAPDGSGTFAIDLTITFESSDSYRGVAVFTQMPDSGPMKALEGTTITTTAKRTGDCVK
jgi:hypothetical protein